MLSPKRTKYRKPHRGHLRGKASRGNKIVFGEFGLQALEPCWITSRQIEAGRRRVPTCGRRRNEVISGEDEVGSILQERPPKEAN